MDRLIVSVSGVRGTVGSALTPQVARDFGCAFGTMLGAGRRVAIGRDTRPSGPTIRDGVTAGLLATGIDVIDLGVVTTPGVALMTRALAADGGVVVTASHNPAEYNGIKFLQPTGPGLRAADAKRLEGIWSAGRFDRVGTDRLGSRSHDETTHRRHVEAVCAIVDTQAIAAKGFTVVLDSINGAGCVVSPMLLGRLGCRLVQINGEPTGQFAHPPEPTRENLSQLCAAAAEAKASVGFAQDPDGDRLVVVDETGRFIGEEYTLALAARHVLRTRRGKVATNLVTSRMIDDVAAEAGCQVVRAPTGEANVVEAMQREGCIFGGEGGGGVIDPRVVCVRDSLVGMALVLEEMAVTGKPISGLVSEIPRYVMVKTKLPCPQQAAAAVIEAARKAFAPRDGARLNSEDGLRVDLPDGWLSVRASNTEPIVRITAEAPRAETADALVAEVRRLAEPIIATAT